MADLLKASVVYLEVGRQHTLDAAVPPGSTLADAITASGLAGRVAGFDLAAHKVGVWGKLKPATTPLHEGDRVEVYRPLQADPNTARQRRVAKRRATGLR